MKFATLAALALAPVALSQSSGNSSQYLQQVLGALQGAGLTSLVQVASAIANDTNGMALLSQLGQGNKTVFAPSNDAFSQVPQNVSSNTTLLTQILSYHILNNTYTANGTQVSPNHTIARTLLNGGMYQLPGNRSAPLVLSRNSTNATMFNINQYSDNVTAMGPTPAANLYVYVINEVLSLPPTLVNLAQQLFPSLAGLIQQAGLLDPLSMAQGITVFAPSDSAISAVAQTLQGANQTVVQTVLANHVINGSVVYSDRLTSANYTSAAGEPFTFMTNSSGTYVMSANSTAKIIRSDLIINNGVVHLIDGILLNTMSNPSAAQSAAASYASAAATQTENTSPVTATSAAATSSAATSRSAAGSAAPVTWASTILGASLATLGLMVGGSATLF